MEIGASTGFCDRIDLDILTALEIISSTPIKVIELWTTFYGKKIYFNWKDVALVKQVKQFVDTHNIEIHSIHAPFSYEYDISSPDTEKQKKVIEDIKEVIVVEEELGGKVIVVHPASKPETSKYHLSLKEYSLRFQKIKEGISELVEFIIKNGYKVKIAIENQLSHIMCSEPEELIEIINSTDRNIVGVCFDTSHAELHNKYNALCSIMRSLQDHIISFHISDTDGKTDDHLPIGEGRIRWYCVFEILREKKYNCPFMLEILTLKKGLNIKQTLIDSYNKSKLLLTNW